MITGVALIVEEFGAPGFQHHIVTFCSSEWDFQAKRCLFKEQNVAVKHFFCFYYHFRNLTYVQVELQQKFQL